MTNHKNITVSLRNVILLSAFAILFLSSTFVFGQTPSISSVSPNAGPVGTSVTITGTNFGATQGTSAVKFNGTSGAPTSWSNTQIVVPVPSGATSGNVSVAVGSKTSPGIVLVQSSVGSNGSGTTASVNISPSAAGNLLIAMQMMPLGPTVSSVTDNVGNTWIHAAGTQSSSTGDTTVLDIWYCPNCSGGVTTITAHDTSTASSSGVIAYEMSGVTTSSPFETGGNLSQGMVSGNSCAGASLTTVFTDLLIGAGDANNGFLGVSTPWIFGSAQDAYILNAVPETYQPTYQVGAGSTSCLASMAAFKSAAGFTVGTTPSIASLSPTSGAVGTSVTITGANFGSTQGTSTVTFNGTAATPTSWSATSIVVPVPNGATTGNVAVTVGGVASNGVSFTVTAPGATIVQHAVANTTGATLSIPISPSGQGNTLIIFTVGSASETVSSITDNAANTYVQAPSARSSSTGDNFFSDVWYCAACTSGVTNVTVHFSVSSNVAAAVYEVSGLATSPFDVAHNLTNGTVSGGNCTGPSISVGVSDVLFALGDADNGFSGISAPWTMVSDGTQIAYDLAAGNGTYQPVFSTGAGSTNCLISEAAFKIATSSGGGGSSTITSISPTTIGIGTQVTITGSGFGSTPEDVAFCDCSNGTIVSWSDTQIVAIPTAVYANSTVSVEVGGIWTNGIPYTEIPGTISNISPTSIGIGTQVTITGSGFGSQPIDVAFCDCSNATIVSWSDTQIVAVPTAVIPNGTVSVEFASAEWTAGFPYTAMTNSSSTATEYSYDNMGRVAQTMTCTPMNCGTSQGFLMTYAYDLAGDLTTLTSNGTSIQYSPTDSPIDGAGRVTKVESGWVDQTHPPVLATIDPATGYSPSGALQNIKYGNNVYESTVYNHRVQPCRINVNTTGAVTNTCEQDQMPSGNIQDFTLNYNETTTDNGNVAGFAASGQQNFNRSYTYDSLNRIQTMFAPGDMCSGLSWTIDAWGNRLSQNTTGGSCFSPQITVDTNNHIMGAPAGCTSSTPFCYDAAGNLLNDGNHIYTYDAENRITQVDNGNTATYLYDSSGRRVEKTVGGSSAQYLYDIDGQINTVFGNGTFQRMYVYLNGKQLAEYFNNTTYFPLTDHLGSTRLLTGADGSVQESDDYYPYGEQITAGTNDLLKFTGKERDSESSLDYFGARHYASSMGRFMTADQAADETIPVPVPFADFRNPQSLNLYSYGLNNPVSNVDPDGHDVHVCVDNSSGGQNCFNMSDKDYANLQQQQNGQNGINMPGGSMPGGNITCGGQVCGSATFFEPGLQDTSLDVAMFIGGVASIGRGLIEGGLGLLRGAGEAGAGTAAREAGVALAEKTVVSGGKAAIRDALENGAVNELQKQAVKRALARGAAGDTFTLTKLADGSIKVTTEVAGRAGGRAVYEKIVDAAGQTTSVVQRAYDASGSLVHVDPKLQ